MEGKTAFDKMYRKFDISIYRKFRYDIQHELVFRYNRVFGIYQILLGWKTYKYYNETDKLPNPRPTEPKKS